MKFEIHIDLWLPYAMRLLFQFQHYENYLWCRNDFTIYSISRFTTLLPSKNNRIKMLSLYNYFSSRLSKMSKYLRLSKANHHHQRLKVVITHSVPSVKENLILWHKIKFKLLTFQQQFFIRAEKAIFQLKQT